MIQCKKPNFFIHIDDLTGMKDHFKSVYSLSKDFTVDMFDMPYWYNVHIDYDKMVIKAYHQIEIYTKDEENLIPCGTLIYRKKEQDVICKASSPEGEPSLSSFMTKYFIALSNLGQYTRMAPTFTFGAEVYWDEKQKKLTKAYGWDTVPNICIRTINNDLVKASPDLMIGEFE